MKKNIILLVSLLFVLFLSWYTYNLINKSGVSNSELIAFIIDEIESIDNKKVIVLILPKVEALQKRIEILQKAHPLILIANTIVQTVLIDMIWNGFPWSNDKAQDLSEIEDITQDIDYNEHVMAAA